MHNLCKYNWNSYNFKPNITEPYQIQESIGIGAKTSRLERTSKDFCRRMPSSAAMPMSPTCGVKWTPAAPWLIPLSASSFLWYYSMAYPWTGPKVCAGLKLYCLSISSSLSGPMTIKCIVAWFVFLGSSGNSNNKKNIKRHIVSPPCQRNAQPEKKAENNNKRLNMQNKMQYVYCLAIWQQATTNSPRPLELTLWGRGICFPAFSLRSSHP